MPDFAVLWDVDGTMCNSPEYASAAVQYYLRRLNISFSDEDFRNLIGNPFTLTHKILRERYELTDPFEEFLSKVNSYELELMRGSYPEIMPRLMPTEGLESLMEDLAGHHAYMAIGTSSGRERTEDVLGLLGLYQDEKFKFVNRVVTREDIKAHKPNPEVYLTIMPKGMKPSNCIVFEDSPPGIEAAKKAGMYVIALVTKFYTSKDLQQLEFKPDMITTSFSGLSYQTLCQYLESVKRAL